MTSHRCSGPKDERVVGAVRVDVRAMKLQSLGSSVAGAKAESLRRAKGDTGAGTGTHFRGAKGDYGTGRKQLASIYVKCAAERLEHRSDAERRNEGFPSW
jgi:hypothetical protein